MGLQRKVLEKLVKMGGVAELHTFGRLEQNRLRKLAQTERRYRRLYGSGVEQLTPWVRISRFNSNGPESVEITADGWKQYNGNNWGM